MDTPRTAEGAQYLADDPIGVEREKSPRKIQRKREDIFYTYLSAGWLRQLNGAAEGELVYHSLSMGRTPIVVTEPAIIIQPLSAMGSRRDGE